MKKIKLFLSFITLVALSMFVLTGCLDKKSSFGKAGKTSKINVDSLIKKAENNDVKSMIKLADSYLYCDGVEGDLKEAFKWYSMAADTGDAYATYMLGYCYDNFLGIDQDHEIASILFNEAAQKGSIDAYFTDYVFDCSNAFKLAKKVTGKDKNYYLGKCYRSGMGVESDPEKGLKLLKSAAQKGSAKACKALAWIYYNENDIASSMKYGEKAAKLLGAVGRYDLAWLQASILKDISNHRSKRSEEDSIINVDENIKRAKDPIEKAHLIAFKKETRKLRAELIKNREKEPKPDDVVHNYGLAASLGYAPALDELGGFDFLLKAYKKGYYKAALPFSYERGAIDYLKSEAVKDMDAAALLAKIFLESGYNRNKNYEEGFKYAKKACENGVFDAKFELAECYFYGKGTEEDKGKAFPLYLEVAEKGKREAAARVGDYYWYGYAGTEKNRKSAFEWYSKAAKKSDADALAKVGICYLEGWETEKDLEKAFAMLRKAYDRLERTDAPYYLGLCYENGWGTEKDPKEAVKLYSFNKDDPRCAYKAAYSYKNGIGDSVEKSLSSAANYFEELKKESTVAALELADIYMKIDKKREGFREFEKLEKTSSYAKYQFAEFYRTGLNDYFSDIVKKSLRKAASYYTQAFALASQNVKEGKADASDYACLGLCYENARGTSKDLEKALEYYKLAAKDSFGNAAERVEALQGKGEDKK